MSKISWPPRGYKPPHPPPTKEDVFATLLIEYLESHQFNQQQKYQITLKWLQKYREGSM